MNFTSGNYNLFKVMYAPPSKPSGSILAVSEPIRLSQPRGSVLVLVSFHTCLPPGGAALRCALSLPCR